MKKLLSLALAVVMVMSVCPTMLATTASAADTPTWSAVSASSSAVSAEVSYSTHVLRVSAGQYSYLKGSKIVAATPSGTPETSGDYAAMAYADESVVLPKVYLALNTAADSTPTLTISSTTGASTSVTPTFSSQSGSTYEWAIPSDGTQTATAGDILKLTFTYTVNGKSYTSYGALNVQSVSGGIAVDTAKVLEANGTGGGYRARFIGGARLIAKNLYEEADRVSTYGGFTGANTDTHKGFNFSITTLERGNDSSQDFYYSDVSQINVGVYMNSNTSNTNPYNLGHANDSNRARATIYIDKSEITSIGSGDTGLDLRYEMFTSGFGDGNDVYATAFYIGYIYLGAESYAVGGSSNSNNLGIDSSLNSFFGSTIGTACPYGTSYAVANSAGKGQYKVVRFGTTQSTPIANLSNSTGSASLKWTFAPEYWGTYGSYTAKSGTSMGISMYVVDKTNIKNLVKMIQTGTTTGGYTASKGANPQASDFTSSTYSAFLTAYQNALNNIANGKTINQTNVDTYASTLYSAYQALERNQGNVTAHFYLQGTSDSVYADSTSPTYDLGSAVTCVAPDITGYTCVSATSQTATCATGAELTFYYAPATYNYTFDPVVVEAGDAKTKGFTFGETFAPLTDAPSFTYNHYEIEGWYAGYNSTTDTYSDRQDSVEVTAEPFTLYAKWTPVATHVHYDMGSTGTTMADSLYYPGDAITQPADPSISGYAFLGWYTDNTYTTEYTWGDTVWYSTTTSTETSPYDDEEITVYALFQSFDGEIVFNVNGGNSVDAVDVDGLAAGTTITLPTPTRTGYTFQGWYENADLTGTVYSAGDIALPSSLVGGGVLYAKWTANSVTINFNLNYNAATASPIDTTYNPDSITGVVGQSISEAAEESDSRVPADPVKYGYDFGGWWISGSGASRTYNDTNAYNSAVNGGAITLLDPATDVIPATNSATITLAPVWIRSTKSAYIQLDAYKASYGEMVPVDEAEIATGDIITVRMTAKSNFYTGSSLFVYMYDNSFFELVGSGSDAFTVNSDNAYISAISGTNGTDYTGYTTSPSRTECPSGYNWIQISIDPDVLGGVRTGGTMVDGTWMVEFKLRVIGTTPGSSGITYMSNDWTRTPDNNSGTMFFSWLESASTTVWNGHNNYVTPNLSLATATVTLPETPVTEESSTVTLNPNGGTWSDSSTGTKSYTGNVGEEILDYTQPTRTGYELTSWQATDDASDTWVEGYYGSAAQSGKTFDAVWTPIKYNVTWNATSGAFGSSTTLTDAIDYDAEYSAPSTLPTRQGYTLAGWSLTEDGDAVTMPQTMDGNEVTYYAKWEPATDTPYSIVVILNGTARSPVTGSAYTGTTGATVHLVADASAYTNTSTDIYLGYSSLPTVANSSIDVTDSRNTDDGTNGCCTIEADGSGVLYVYYCGKTITSTFDANGGTYTIPATSSDLDAHGWGYNYTSDTTYVITSQFVTGATIANPDNAQEPALKPVDPVRTGYTFLGWSTNKNATAAANLNAATTDRTYYAVWSGITVTNTFNANGGTFADSALTTTADTVYGKTIVVPATAPTRSGYEFLGYARVGGTEAETLGTESSTTGETFYAIWKLTNQSYNINIYYMGLDGTYGDADVSTTLSATGAISIDTSAYAQEGFTLDDTVEGTLLSSTLDETTIGTTITLKAYYKRNQHVITFTNGLEGDAADSTATTVYYGADTTALAPTYTREGYTFNGWSAEVPTSMPDEDVTINATWKVNTYNLYFKTISGEEYIDFVSGQRVDYGTAISAPEAVPSITGYTFEGWNIDASATTGDKTLSGVTMPAGDVTYYAIFSIQSHDAIFMSEGAEFTRVAYNYGVQVTDPSPLPTKYGYTFTGWTPSLKTMGTDDQTYTAIFTAKDIDVTFDANNGAFSDSSATAVVSSKFDGTIATPTAPTRAGYTFAGWAAAADATSGTLSLGTLTTETPDTYYAVWTARTNNKYVINIYQQDTTGTYPTEPTSSSIGTDGVTATEKTIVPEAITGFTLDTAASTLTLTIAVDTGTGSNNIYNVYYIRNAYKLTVDDDGTVTESNVYYGAAVTDPTPAGKTGYTFTSWTWTDADDNVITKPATMPAAEVKATAVYTINSYTAKFYDYDDSLAGTTTADYNTAITAIADPVRTGYTFAGWAAEKNGTKLDTLGNMPLNGTSFYALYTANDYDVTFNAGEGTFGDSNVTTVSSTFDSAINLPTAPTRTGYTFAGWATTADAATGSTELGNLTVTTSADSPLTYYAVWTVNSYTATFLAADGSTYNTEDFDYGTAIDPANKNYPEKTGYTCIGWSRTEGATAPDESLGNMDSVSGVTFYPVFTINSYTITYRGLSGCTFSDAAASQTSLTAQARTDTYEYGASIVPAVPVRTGYSYKFSVEIPSTMPASNINVQISWTANNYDAIFVDAEGTEITRISTAFNSAISADTVTAPEKTGYTFAGWSRTEGATAPDASLGVMDNVAGVTIYPVFTVNTYTATFKLEGGNIDGSEADVTTTADYNASITAPTSNPAKTGYTFQGWAATAGGEKLDSLGTMPVNGTTFYAVYTVNAYQFTYIVDGVASEPENVNFGEAITAPAAPTKEGYTFAGWTPSIPATMPAENVTVTAEWTINNNTATFYNYDGSAVLGTKNFDYNQAITVPTGIDTTREGYTFQGWAAAVDGEKLETLGTMPDGAIAFYAVYTINSYALTVTYVYSDNTAAAETYTDSVVYNTDYSVASPEIKGYTADITTVTGTMPAEAVNVRVTYTVNTYNVNVTYVTPEGVEAPAAVTEAHDYGTAYSIASPAIEGYTPDMATVAGTMSDADVNVTVTYTVNSYTLTVTYVYTDKTTAAETYTDSVVYNTAYSVASPAIEGYTPDTATVAGTMPAKNVDVKVTYSINSYNLTITYVYADGTTAADTFTTKVEYNADYSRTSPEITGYTPDQATVTGKMPADNVDVEVKYAVNQYDLTVNYVMPDSTEAPAAYTAKVDYNAAYSVASPAVEGYTAETETVTGTMPADNVTVTVYYSINAYTVTFVKPADANNQLSGTKTVVDINDATTYTAISAKTLNYNAVITVPADPSISNYTFEGWTWYNADTGAVIDAAANVPANNVIAVAEFTRVPVTLEVVATKNTVIDEVDAPTAAFTGYIYGLDTRITTAQFESEYAQVVGDGHLVVTPVAAYSAYDLCGTGTKVELIDNVTNEVVATYYVVVYGDLNGDGNVNNSDVQVMRMEVAKTPNKAVGALWSVDSTGNWLNPDSTSAPIMLAADLNGDGQVTSADTTILRNITTGQATVDQVTGTVTMNA